jgi:asparagine synthase (glutamine-hydrolysing)
MCGIAGWVAKHLTAPEEILKRQMEVDRVLDRQHHRGPDARGTWISPCNRAVLGHNRLAIVDLSNSGAQPMSDADNDWAITYNGELYNYRELRALLQKKFGVKFRGHSDTEVFLYGVKHLGIDEFLRHAEGMFAAALFSSKSGVTYLVRDRAGEKPLYYKQSEDGIHFASELKPLVKGLREDKPTIDRDALYLYLLLRYVPAPFTMFEGYAKVRQGHYLVLQPGMPVRECAFFSWDPHASEVPPNPKNFAEVVRVTERMLVRSLEQRLMSDVPLGFFLSGGVDSTLTAALVRKHFGIDINTYTIGFEGDPESEHEVSAQTARMIGSRHTTRIFTPNELGDVSQRVIRGMDEPNGDRSCIPTFLLCEHARTEVTVALGGDGGDELFGGYARYPGLDKRIGENFYPRAYDGLMVYFADALPVFSPSAAAGIVGRVPPRAQQWLQSLAVPLYSPCRPEVDIRYVDFNSYLSGGVLPKVDRMSMQVSLEVRTPFFSKELLSMASRLPHEFLYQGKQMKPVLRQICKGLGLEHVAGLKKKGFGMPAQFLFTGQDQLMRRANAALIQIAAKLDDKALTKRMANTAGDNMNSLWATIVLGEWLEASRV